MSARNPRRFFAIALLTSPALFAQVKPGPDVIVFADGERLVGRFERSNGSSVVFKSDMIGEITVDWSKIGEFQSSKKLAVIPKGIRLRKGGGSAAVPQGTVAVAGTNLAVTPESGAVQSVAVANVDHVLDEAVFQKALDHAPGFFSDWTGTVTAGASLVEATQQSQSFNGALNLVRVDPSEDWLTRRNRTTVAFSEAYGTVRQPNTPEVKTDILHLGLERDEYFSPALFGFGQALLDHNFSQGLSLEQTYGGGIGWSVIKRVNTGLDLKASASYINQNFGHSEARQSLIASTFEEDYRRVMLRGIVFNEQLLAIPAWNNTKAYSATAKASLTLPVYKRLGSSIGIIDGYLNDPPPAFKKNSFQFTAGLTYSLK